MGMGGSQGRGVYAYGLLDLPPFRLRIEKAQVSPSSYALENYGVFFVFHSTSAYYCYAIDWFSERILPKYRVISKGAVIQRDSVTECTQIGALASGKRKFTHPSCRRAKIDTLSLGFYNDYGRIF